MDHLENGDTTMLSRRTVAGFWCVAISLGIIRAWSARHSMNPDGVSYLDMGDAYWRGDWSVAINAYWSPMYSWLIGLVLLIFRPPPYWEFTALHALNFVIYLGLLLSFAFFWREIVAWRKGQDKELSRQGISGLPDLSWTLLGYSMALWCALNLVGLAWFHPDLLLGVFVLLAAGFVTRIRAGAARWSDFVLLGSVLGAGYLAKAPMFPLGFVFLATAFFCVGDIRKAVPRVLLASTVFLLVCSPLLIALSSTKGHFTFGQSWSVNYDWFFSGQAGGEQGGAKRGTPVEAPLPIILPTMTGVTYAPWYDPTIQVSSTKAATPGPPPAAPSLAQKVQQRLKYLVTNANVIYIIFLRGQRHLVAGILILVIMGRRWRSSLWAVLQSWHVLIPTCVALGAYALLVVKDRYVAPFVPLLWAGVFPAVQLEDSKESNRLMNSVAIVVAILFAIQLLAPATNEVRQDLGSSGHAEWDIIQNLHSLGLQPGDKVGVIGTGMRATYWARLGRFSIVAEIPPQGAEAFWSASLESRQRSLEAFTGAGARAVVMQIQQPRDALPEVWQHSAAAEGWQRLGNTGLYAYVPSR